MKFYTITKCADGNSRNVYFMVAVKLNYFIELSSYLIQFNTSGLNGTFFTCLFAFWLKQSEFN